jgi:endonuclease/exonuclease/phosphatase (EEP) superfamily protein YafD
MFQRQPLALFARLGVLILAGITAGGFAGALWWALDLFAHFRFQYVVAAVMLAALLLTLRDRRFALLAAAVAAINLLPVASLFTRPAEAAPRGEAGSLRIMALNVLDFNQQYDRVIAYARRERPDVLLLVELTPQWADRVADLAPEYPHRWVGGGVDGGGIAMMSRRAPTGAEALMLDAADAPSYLLTFDLPDGPLSVLGTQLEPPLGARASRERNQRLAALARFARDHRGPLAIVGDLNTSPFSPHFQRLARDGGLHRCGQGAGLVPTWPSLFPPLWIQLDHCLANDAVRSWGFTVGEYVGSDHFPISVYVAPRLSTAGPSSPK